MIVTRRRLLEYRGEDDDVARVIERSISEDGVIFPGGLFVRELPLESRPIRLVFEARIPGSDDYVFVDMQDASTGKHLEAGLWSADAGHAYLDLVVLAPTESPRVDVDRSGEP